MKAARNLRRFRPHQGRTQEAQQHPRRVRPRMATGQDPDPRPRPVDLPALREATPRHRRNSRPPGAHPHRPAPTPRPRQPHRRMPRLQQRTRQPGTLPPLMLAIVTGPPCSGKSTWIRQRAGPGDIHLDRGALPVAFDHAPRHDSSVSGSSLRIASTRPPRPGINREGRIRHRPRSGSDDHSTPHDCAGHVEI